MNVFCGLSNSKIKQNIVNFRSILYLLQIGAMRHEVARRTEETNRLQTEIENVRRAEAHQYKEVGIAFLIFESSKISVCVGEGSF